MLSRKFVLVGCLFLCGFLSNSELYAQERRDSMVAVQTTDGNEYIGLLIDSDSSRVVLSTQNLGPITIKQSDVLSITYIERGGSANRYSSTQAENPYAWRYFAGVSGYNIPQGQFVYYNTMAFINQIGYGVSENLSITLGGIPTFIFGVDVVPLWVHAKLSIPISENKWNAGAGVLYILPVGEEEESAGFIYGVSTHGTKDKHISFILGNGFDRGGLWDNLTVGISGTYRTGRRHYLLTDSYWLGAPNERVFIFGFGGRFVARRLALEYGIAHPVYNDFNDSINTTPIGIPHVGLIVPLGRRND
jgi:hypothetical protein